MSNNKLIQRRNMQINLTAEQKRREGGARGGGRPSNVLQDNFSDSSISCVKIAGGGGVRPILAIIMCKSTGFFNLATSIAFSHDLYGIEFFSRGEARRLSFYVRSKFAYLISIGYGGRKSRSLQERGERSLVVA